MAVLAGMTTKELFPQLWAVRNRLTEIAGELSPSTAGSDSLKRGQTPSYTTHEVVDKSGSDPDCTAR